MQQVPANYDEEDGGHNFNYEKPFRRTQICGISRPLFFIGVAGFTAMMIAAIVLASALKPSQDSLIGEDVAAGYVMDSPDDPSSATDPGGVGSEVNPSDGTPVDDPSEGTPEGGGEVEADPAPAPSDDDVGDPAPAPSDDDAGPPPGGGSETPEIPDDPIIEDPVGPDPEEGEVEGEGDSVEEPPPGPGPIPPVTYQYLVYEDIVNRLHELEAAYPALVEVYTTQERYGVGEAGNCPLAGHGQPCKVWVIRITNKALETPTTPEVFLSGALHGNERIGPTSVTEFATTLLQLYEREDEWAKVLVDTRAITIVPMPNAIGYLRSEREEVGRDPNRDFAWDQNPSECMRTVAGQSINELWRHHIFQLSITFHGGDHLISYTWGDYIHCCGGKTYQAPDETGMHALTAALRDYSGSFSREGKYRIGALNDIIYQVRGGMEDWAYGASWESSGRVQCNGGHYHYPSGRTTYNNATHRAVNLLVETSQHKIPPASELGTNADVVRGWGGSSRGHQGDGHIPRNIRLCWMMLDAVQPWVRLANTDLLPTIVSGGMEVVIEWKVGGAFQLSSVAVECLAPGASAPDASLCSSQPLGHSVNLWQNGEPQRSFSTTMTVGEAAGGPLRVRVVVEVDLQWASPSRTEHQKGVPQSHLVRARTDESWFARNVLDGEIHEVHGHKRWYSEEATITARRRSLPRPGLSNLNRRPPGRASASASASASAAE